MTSGEAQKLSEDVSGFNPDDLAVKLVGYPGSSFRRAYLETLLASGRNFQVTGNLRGAGYCFSKVAEALNESEVVQAKIDGEHQKLKAAEKAHAATESLRGKWRQERIQAARNVLDKHGSRLSALENRTYREKLAKLSETGIATSSDGRAEVPSDKAALSAKSGGLSAKTGGLSAKAEALQSDKADAGLLDLRRRLYSRVLKSQKVSLKYRRLPTAPRRYSLPQGMPIASGSLRLSTASSTSSPSTSLSVPAKPQVQVDTAWQPITGPYNDRYNLQDLLSLIADSDPVWVEEFLDLYSGMSGMQDLMSSIAPKK